MKQEVLKKIVLDSIAKFLKYDSYLFEVNSSERSMTHRLATYVETHHLFDKSFTVDCEYNRNGLFPKSVAWRNETDENSVYPDIIIHRRGEQGPNLLILEAKKSKTEIDNDVAKLKAYIKELSYKLGICVVLENKALEDLHIEWFE